VTNLKLDQLQAFLAVVRSGGVRRASEQLRLTQPAVSARIKALEESLGVVLFERAATGMRLTKRGELLLNHTQQIAQLTEYVKRDVVDPAGVLGTLRIGVSETIAQCWLPDLISALTERFPKLQLEINVDVSVNLRAALMAREIDLAILMGPVSEFSIDNVELPTFPLAWCCSAALEIPANPADMLARMPMVTYAKNTRPFRELKRELLVRVGPEVRLFSSSSLSAGFRLVEVGQAVAAMPRQLAQRYVDAGALQFFEPGWVPNALKFTASFVGDGEISLAEQASEIARRIAVEYDLACISANQSDQNLE